MDLGIWPILRLFVVSGEEGEHSLICVVDLKHGVGEELEELLHLERGWSFVRLRELGLHHSIGV